MTSPIKITRGKQPPPEPLSKHQFAIWKYLENLSLVQLNLTLLMLMSNHYYAAFALICSITFLMPNQIETFLNICTMLPLSVKGDS